MVVSSLAGGSFIIVEVGLHEWVTGCMGDDCSRWVLLLFVDYPVGLWSVGFFNFIDKQEGKTIVEVIKEFKKARKDIEKQLMCRLRAVFYYLRKVK